jgi:nitrite transporter NirC
MKLTEVFQKSILAGILIGFGVIINLQSSDPVVVALLFSFGLLTIIEMQLLLYTGKIGFLEEDLMPMLIPILIFNCIGIAITVFLYGAANPDFNTVIANAASIKFAKGYLTLFINACFCGALIHFAVKNKVKILTIFAIMIFILIGAEHCIADFPYLLYAPSFENVCKFIEVVCGNSMGALMIERLTW